MPHEAISAMRRGSAKRLRKQLTEAERRLWHRLRAHRLGGFGFKRQMPIGDYIVDFACRSSRLVVEVDGSQHGFDANVEADLGRTKKLEEIGWFVIRFWNHEVTTDLEAVCNQICAIALERGSDGAA
jgi:very-short-patch-repair endonuclease